MKAIVKPVTTHYSNQQSANFWKQVNSLKDESDRQELYSLGVALQNMEGFVLRQLAVAKKSAVCRKRALQLLTNTHFYKGIKGK